MLEIRNISKSFGGLKALREVTLTVSPKEILGIIGPNGAGKTTLFNVISGFCRPDRGTVSLNGERVDHLSSNQIALKGIGRTFQVTKIFKSFSVMDNLRVVCPNSQVITEALEYAQLSNLVDREAGVLSLFEEKRLEMAMALALRPKVLLMDELTSGLTSYEKRYFEELIRRIKQDLGTAFVLIEHDVKMAVELSDQISVLYYGTVLASGEPAAVMRDEKVINDYLGRKAL
jgi:branched-chain amino acid transport system ATP-binding protein